MLLENIKNFDWVNEPQNVEFIEKGMLITTKPLTDFWQNSTAGFSKDNGHFFSRTQAGDFEIFAKWSFDTILESAQCGIMVKFDSKNWIKTGILSTNPYKPQIGVVTANNGACDWSIVEAKENCKGACFRIRRKGPNFIVYYSENNEDYKQIRMITQPSIGSVVEIGAYACSPKDECFDCILEEIDIKI